MAQRIATTMQNVYVDLTRFDCFRVKRVSARFLTTTHCNPTDTQRRPKSAKRRMSKKLAK